MKQKKSANKTLQKVNKNDFLQSEWSTPKSAKISGKKWNLKVRKEYLRQLFSRGIIDPSKKDLAELMGISRIQLYKDFQAIYEEGIAPDEAQKNKVILNYALKNALVEVSLLVTKNKGNDKLPAVRELCNVIEKYTNFLEKFGIKPVNYQIVDNKIEVRWMTPDELEEHHSTS